MKRLSKIIKWNFPITLCTCDTPPSNQHQEQIENLVTTAQQKIRHHEEQVRLLGSCPKINCNIHSSNNVEEIIDSNSTTNTEPKGRNDCDDEGFNSPPKRNTVKAPIYSHSAITQTNNKFFPTCKYSYQ
ncbi:hypothetical protein CDAR_113661 [Caerostris darwini]|uniref:Uncharacterized protein n=1 Tax=Caerostris darwini TaxID=1538125 RepID=A0AAV4S070_9ARAC|nr:hypothetical protein CDAR_113661 [Caerostris darwini]